MESDTYDPTFDLNYQRIDFTKKTILVCRPFTFLWSHLYSKLPESIIVFMKYLLCCCFIDTSNNVVCTLTQMLCCCTNFLCSLKYMSGKEGNHRCNINYGTLCPSESECYRTMFYYSSCKECVSCDCYACICNNFYGEMCWTCCWTNIHGYDLCYYYKDNCLKCICSFIFSTICFLTVKIPLCIILTIIMLPVMIILFAIDAFLSLWILLFILVVVLAFFICEN